MLDLGCGRSNVPRLTSAKARLFREQFAEHSCCVCWGFSWRQLYIRALSTSSLTGVPMTAA